MSKRRFRIRPSVLHPRSTYTHTTFLSFFLTRTARLRISLPSSFLLKPFPPSHPPSLPSPWPYLPARVALEVLERHSLQAPHPCLASFVVVVSLL